MRLVQFKMSLAALSGSAAAGMSARESANSFQAKVVLGVENILKKEGCPLVIRTTLNIRTNGANP